MGGEGVVTDEERVRALVASLAEPVVVLDSERRLVAASPVAAAALGEAVPGRRVGEDVGGALVLFVGDLPELSAYQELRAGFTAAQIRPLQNAFRQLFWRPRNLRQRVEVVTPVVDAACRARLDRILEDELADPTAWELEPDGGYRRRTATPGADPRGSQERLLALTGAAT